MKRTDYNKFLTIAKDKLPEGYDLFGIHNETDMDNMLTRVINTRTIDFSDEFLEKFHGFPFCSGIDIFPLDYIAPDPEDDRFVKEVIDIVNSVAKVVDMAGGCIPEVEEKLCEIEEMCGVQLSRDNTLFQQLNILVDNLCSLYTEEEASDITIMTLWLDGGTYKFPKEYYSRSVRIPFENTTIPVPAFYDSILKKKYGDYMKPVHTWDSHDYPFYNRQIETLKKETGAAFIKFNTTYEDIQQFDENKKKIRQARKAEKCEMDCRREIVFLPYKSETWNAFDSLWRAAKEDSNTDVYVIPTPYYYKNMDGSTEMNFNTDKYPENVVLTSFEQYNIKERCPDVIIIQNPYDEYNYTTTMHPMFYAKNLSEYTDKLVYVPYFVTDEIDKRDERALRSMDSYCLMPGVVYSDEIIVQSEAMAELYVDKLCEMAGEESRQYWIKKINGTGSPLNDVKRMNVLENVPEEWKKILAGAQDKPRKAILMYTSASGLLEYEEKMIDKIRRVFGTFSEYNETVVLLWYWETNMEQTVQEIDYKLWADFIDMLSQINIDNFIAVKDNQLKAAVNLCDGYYGEAGLVAQECRNAKKPVMLLDVKC
ncbi:MAG: LicD family protein, partial [Eubacteriales bacterium]|nr:LicD family protein [Eubacteriales bacterium]